MLRPTTAPAIDLRNIEFQSRAGFSECFDRRSCARCEDAPTPGFNPVLGFLSASTRGERTALDVVQWFQSRAGFSECFDPNSSSAVVSSTMFQSRAGFSECFDKSPNEQNIGGPLFQSRAGFSECFDRRSRSPSRSQSSFNPVLGFLSASTGHHREARRFDLCFNPVLGFLSASTNRMFAASCSCLRFQSRAGFSECFDPTLRQPRRHGDRVSIPCWVF